MGREQGDDIPANPPVYVRTVNGVEEERSAFTPADEVNLKAQGWVRKTETARHGGKREHVQARVIPSKAAADTESSNG